MFSSLRRIQEQLFFCRCPSRWYHQESGSSVLSQSLCKGCLLYVKGFWLSVKAFNSISPSAGSFLIFLISWLMNEATALYSTPLAYKKHKNVNWVTQKVKWVTLPPYKKGINSKHHQAGLNMTKLWKYQHLIFGVLKLCVFLGSGKSYCFVRF